MHISIIDLYFQEFAAALVAGTLPVDFNGINETGWEQLGTVLNKANLLSDETAEMYRLSGEEAVPNDVLNQIYVMIQMMQVKKAYVSVSVQLSDGTPVGGVQLSNTIKTLDGDIVYTDSAGKASGYVDEGTIVLSTLNCIDVAGNVTTDHSLMDESTVRVRIISGCTAPFLPFIPEYYCTKTV